MKCPRCWSDKAYLRRVPPWKRFLLGCLFLTPMRCQHCYHKFVVVWFSTIGKVVEPPQLRIAPITRGIQPRAGARRLEVPNTARSIPSVHRHRNTRRADAA